MGFFNCIFVFDFGQRHVRYFEKKISRHKGLRTSYNNAVGSAKKVWESPNSSASKLLGAKSKWIIVSRDS